MFCQKCGAENKDTAKFCQDCRLRFSNDENHKIGSQKKGTWIVFGFCALILLLFIWSLLTSGMFNLSIFGKPSIHIDEAHGISLFGSATIKFNIYNSGNAAANNVYALVNVIDPDTGKTLHSKRIFIGNLNPGESKSITTSLPDDIPATMKFTVIPQY